MHRWFGVYDDVRPESVLTVTRSPVKCLLEIPRNASPMSTKPSVLVVRDNAVAFPKGVDGDGGADAVLEVAVAIFQSPHHSVRGLAFIEHDVVERQNRM